MRGGISRLIVLQRCRPPRRPARSVTAIGRARLAEIPHVRDSRSCAGGRRTSRLAPGGARSPPRSCVCAARRGRQPGSPAGHEAQRVVARACDPSTEATPTVTLIAKAWTGTAWSVSASKRSAVRRETARRPTTSTAAGPAVCTVRRRSHAQALDRTQPGLPLKKGRAGTRLQAKRHDDALRRAERPGRNRHSAATCRHPIRSSSRFLNAIETAVPHGKHVHAILDNYAAHKHPKSAQWLDRHAARWTSLRCRPPSGIAPRSSRGSANAGHGGLSRHARRACAMPRRATDASIIDQLAEPASRNAAANRPPAAGASKRRHAVRQELAVPVRGPARRRLRRGRHFVTAIRPLEMDADGSHDRAAAGVAVRGRDFYTLPAAIRSVRQDAYRKIGAAPSRRRGRQKPH